VRTTSWPALTDVDIATDMPLEKLSAVFRTHEVGRSKDFDTVVITRRGRAFEVSGSGAGRPASTRGFRSHARGHAHRDFTITRCSWTGRRCRRPPGRPRGPARRVVKAVGSPRARSPRPARILRAVRFAACLGFAIEDKTGAAVAGCAPLLATVAGSGSARKS